MNISVILAYFVFIAGVLVCFSLYFYSYFLKIFQEHGCTTGGKV